MLKASEEAEGIEPLNSDESSLPEEEAFHPSPFIHSVVTVSPSPMVVAFLIHPAAIPPISEEIYLLAQGNFTSLPWGNCQQSNVDPPQQPPQPALIPSRSVPGLKFQQAPERRKTLWPSESMLHSKRTTDFSNLYRKNLDNMCVNE